MGKTHPGVWVFITLQLIIDLYVATHVGVSSIGHVMVWS